MTNFVKFIIRYPSLLHDTVSVGSGWNKVISTLCKLYVWLKPTVTLLYTVCLCIHLIFQTKDVPLDFIVRMWTRFISFRNFWLICASRHFYDEPKWNLLSCDSAGLAKLANDKQLICKVCLLHTIVKIISIRNNRFGIRKTWFLSRQSWIQRVVRGGRCPSLLFSLPCICVLSIFQIFDVFARHLM